MKNALKIAGIITGATLCAAVITDIVVTAIATKKLLNARANEESDPFCEGQECDVCDYKDICGE